MAQDLGPQASEQMQAWTDDLGNGSISEADRHAILVSESARSFVLDGLESADHDSLHAWAVLGRVLADAGASPTLAAHTVDTLRAVALRRGADAKWCAGARAALIEAYVAAQRERAELRMAESWRFPRCVVRLDERTAAENGRSMRSRRGFLAGPRRAGRCPHLFRHRSHASTNLRLTCPLRRGADMIKSSHAFVFTACHDRSFPFRVLVG
jgi:hypothetical protein